MPEKPTPEQVDEYIKQGGVKCPKCGHFDVQGDSIEVEAGSAYQQVFCPKCEFRWTDKYDLVAIHDTDNSNEFEGTGDEIDEALVLKPGNEGSDYLLKDSHGSVWVEIGNIVAYVRRVDVVDPKDKEKTVPEGVAVDLIPTVCAHETLDCCNADFGQAEEHECRKCGEYNGGGEGFDGMCGSCADEAEEERNDRPEEGSGEGSQG